jgi:hypothetical protein
MISGMARHERTDSTPEEHWVTLAPPVYVRPTDDDLRRVWPGHLG